MKDKCGKQESKGNDSRSKSDLYMPVIRDYKHNLLLH
jgi:hypothetical protein